MALATCSASVWRSLSLHWSWVVLQSVAGGLGMSPNQLLKAPCFRRGVDNRIVSSGFIDKLDHHLLLGWFGPRKIEDDTVIIWRDIIFVGSPRVCFYRFPKVACRSCILSSFAADSCKALSLGIRYVDTAPWHLGIATVWNDVRVPTCR